MARAVSSIHQLKVKFRRTGTVLNAPRWPRGRVTTRHQDRYLVLTHLRNRFIPASETARQTIGANNRPSVSPNYDKSA